MPLTAKLQPVALTDEELLEHGAQAADVAAQISVCEDEIDTLKSRLRIHLQIIKQKIEYRPPSVEANWTSPAKAS